MKIELVWDETVPNVVHYRFHPGWTWEDFRQTAIEEHRWGEAQNGARYDIIGDLRQATLPRAGGFSNVVRVFDKGPANRRMIVIVGSTLARSLIPTAGALYPRVKGRFHYSPTIEEARRFILKLREEQDSLSKK
jgi:hypothetical protein